MAIMVHVYVLMNIIDADGNSMDKAHLTYSLSKYGFAPITDT